MRGCELGVQSATGNRARRGRRKQVLHKAVAAGSDNKGGRNDEEENRQGNPTNGCQRAFDGVKDHALRFKEGTGGVFAHTEMIREDSVVSDNLTNRISHSGHSGFVQKIHSKCSL